MSPIPVAAGILAGFVLAHAVWNVSDMPVGGLLVPLAVIEIGGERHLQRFVAESQEQAIAAGKAAMQEAMTTADAWAFARDGRLKRDGRLVDALAVDFWAKGMTKPVSVFQVYQPPSDSGRFRLLGDPVLVLDGVVQSPEAGKALLKQIRKGIRSHSQASALWGSWQ